MRDRLDDLTDEPAPAGRAKCRSPIRPALLTSGEPLTVEEAMAARSLTPGHRTKAV
ncbi:hypothetical protein LZG04_15160 [Saccharothrix sp. S26]|uniref:hypothetical protein n=1 Tax=Saccharothrix sp. S26 TaxID=2907215 RepID=UPI001F2871F5|nr:hypothetical protein [Saccharothrix sp. S26]MCE6996132.1 hypothetical protein [Saccharothrix sp. S26]